MDISSNCRGIQFHPPNWNRVGPLYYRVFFYRVYFFFTLGLGVCAGGGVLHRLRHDVQGEPGTAAPPASALRRNARPGLSRAYRR